MARRLGLRTPHQQRALAGLLRGSRRSNRAIAAWAGCDEKVVRQVRRRLEDSDVLGTYRDPGGQPAPPSSVAARELLAADPARSSYAIASLAGSHQATVTGIRHQMEAAREIHVWRFGKHRPACWCADEAQ